MPKPKAMQAAETFYQHHLVVTTDRRAWERLCRLSLDLDELYEHLIQPGTGGRTLHTKWKTGGNVVCIWIDPDLYPATVSHRAGVIAHEAAHAARFILDAIGETTRTHEIEPYLIGDITAAIWRMIHQETTQ